MRKFIPTYESFCESFKINENRNSGFSLINDSCELYRLDNYKEGVARLKGVNYPKDFPDNWYVLDENPYYWIRETFNAATIFLLVDKETKDGFIINVAEDVTMTDKNGMELTDVYADLEEKYGITEDVLLDNLTDDLFHYDQLESNIKSMFSKNTLVFERGLLLVEEDYDFTGMFNPLVLNWTEEFLAPGESKLKKIVGNVEVAATNDNNSLPSFMNNITIDGDLIVKEYTTNLENLPAKVTGKFDLSYFEGDLSDIDIERLNKISPNVILP